MPRTELLRSVSVLVVEDYPHYRHLLITTLERSGARVTETGSADDAMKLIASDAPDVVVSDIELPRSSGYDLMERINREDPKIPVLSAGRMSSARNVSTLPRAPSRDWATNQPQEEIMRLVTLAGALLLLFVASSAFAQVGETRTWYSDSAMSNMVGKRYIPYVTNPCEDDWEYWYGTLGGAYKKIEWWDDCYETSLYQTSCYYWDGDSYEPMSCP